MTSTFAQTPATPDTGGTRKKYTLYRRYMNSKKGRLVTESCCCLRPIFTFHCMRPENISAKLRSVQFTEGLQTSVYMPKDITDLVTEYISYCVYVDRFLCICV